MKAHIAIQAILLGCQLDDQTARELTVLGEAVGYRLRRAERSEAGRTVGALCGMPGASRHVEAVPADMTKEPILVLYQFTGAKLDALLAGMKSCGIQIDLKAVATQTNKGWSLVALSKELGEEHAALAAQAAQTKENA